MSVPEIEYTRQNARCIAALLNAAKQEFDLHPIQLSPAQAYSPASIAKAYLDEMGIVPPSEKFNVPNEILGIAMESYTAGRSETRIRHAEVPVVPVDFISEYPTTCALLELMEILTAESLSFEDATADVHSLLDTMTLDKCFNRELWPEFRFFALVMPDRDIFPIRTMYNGFTQTIGNNYLTSDKPIWVAGPDVVNSVIQTSKVPRIVRALKLVPHGRQSGLKPVALRGTVTIDPQRDDLFRKVIGERKRHKSDKELSHWLKIFTNAIYGCFVEINPEVLPQGKPARVQAYSGEESFVPEKRYQVVERQGRWYAPYLASLITSGGRLLLGMLEKCVADAGGVRAWADTDALAIVSSKNSGALTHVPGCENARILTWSEVQAIVDRFADLNPYSFSGSILNLVDDNFVDSDPTKPQRQLLGLSISAKRYTVYERDGERITIVNPKAHGLGYLYPPADSPKGWDDEHDVPKWIYEAWEFLLRMALRLKGSRPAWLDRPQMMRMAVTTHSLLKRLHGWERLRPYNSFLVPILADCGYPANIDPNHFTLVTPFERDQSKWMDSVCINIDDLNDTKQYRLGTSFDSPKYGERAIVATFEGLLYHYLYHPESKSLDPNGKPCTMLTRGLLQRAHIIAGKHRRIGKEVDRRWEEGDDLDSARQRPIEYEPAAAKGSREATSIPSEALSRLVKDTGIRKLMRLGCGRRILEKIRRRQPVKTSTLLEYESRIRRYVFETSKAAATCSEEQNGKQRNDGSAERGRQSAASPDRPTTEALASDPAITQEIPKRQSWQNSPNLIPVQEVKKLPEAVPGPRRGWKWILGCAVGVLIVVGAAFIARRLGSRSTEQT